MSHKFLLL